VAGKSSASACPQAIDHQPHILHTRHRNSIARRLEVGQYGGAARGGQLMCQVAVLDRQTHAKQRSTASGSKRSIGWPGCLQHRGFIDRDKDVEVGVPTRPFQQLADVDLRGNFSVPNGKCCG
jgi:hypothetical protein